jgi:hypothetical protein
MGGNGRRRAAQARRSAVLVVMLAAGTTAGCRLADRDTLAVVERVPIPGAFNTLHIDAAGEVWLGATAELLRLPLAGGSAAAFPIGDAGTPEILGRNTDLVYAWSDGVVAVVDAAGDSVLVERGEMPADAAALDVHGRFLLRTTEAGSVISHHPTTLEAIWGWAAVGAPGTSLALSPEGDRLYQAIGGHGAGSASELLVRDLQTGRILRRVGLVDPIRELAAAPDGSLLAVVGDDGHGGVLRLAWRGGRLETDWRRTFADLRIRSGPVRLRVAPGGDRLAVLVPADDNGLHVLDVETGHTIGRLRGDHRDLSFDALGRIFLLHPGELRRVE